MKENITLHVLWKYLCIICTYVLCRGIEYIEYNITKYYNSSNIAKVRYKILICLVHKRTKLLLVQYCGANKSIAMCIRVVWYLVHASFLKEKKKPI